MKLLWLDLETTGLDPETDAVLEVALMEADHLDPFNAVPVYTAVLALDPTRELTPFIRDMHTRNGLLPECYTSSVARFDAEDAMLHYVAQEERRADYPVLAGSSVHFDHDFLKVHMPRLARRLSHRHYDVSSIKLFCESIGMPPLPKAGAHRAIADVLESIDHAARCAHWVAWHS